MTNRKFPQQMESNSNFGFFFLLLYTIFVFVRPQEWTLEVITFPFARICLIISFVSYLLMQKPKVWGQQAYFLCGLIFVIFLSGVRNFAISDGFNEAIDFFIYSILPFLLYAGLVNTPKKLNWIILVLSFACCIMIQHGIGQKFSVDGIGWSGVPLSQGTRISYVGIFNDPNDLAMFFIMNIPLVFYLISISGNKILKFSGYVLVSLLFYGVFLTNSRGGLVGLLALSASYIYFRYGKVKSMFIFSVALPAAYVVMSVFRKIDSSEDSAQGRINAWYDGIQMFKYRPLFGVGKGQFEEIHYRAAHNSFVLIMAELGTFGFVLWFMTIALTMMMLIKIFNLSKEKYANSPALLADIFFAKCIFLSFIGFLSTAFFLSRTYEIFVYIFLGLACSLYYRVLKQVPEIGVVTGKNMIFKIFISGFFALIGLYFIIILLL